MRSLYLFTFCMLLTSLGWAQADTGGRIVADMPIGLNDLLQTHLEFNKEREFKGYRVQVYSGTTKYGAFEKKKSLESLHPNLKSYIEFESPYYKLRVGNYRNRFEAYSVYKSLILDFPAAAIYPSEIEIPLAKMGTVNADDGAGTVDEEKDTDDGN